MLKVIYSLFFICGIFGGSKYIVGSISYRQLMSVIMLILCLYYSRYLYKTVNKYIILYIVFIFFWIISSIHEGSLNLCVHQIFSQHLIALIGYFATILLYRKIGSIDLLFKLLLFSGTINAIICYLQFIGNPIGIGIGLFFVDLTEIDTLNQFEALASGEGEGRYLYGLFGNAVYNGYFSMLLPFLPLYYYCKNTPRINIFPYLAGCLFFLFILFIIQERSCFLISSFMLFVLLYKIRILRGKNLIIGSIIAIIVLLFSGYDYVINNDIVKNSRLLSNNDEARDSIYIEAATYIINNWLFGGIQHFRSIAHYSPHNIFFNAFIYGGILGGSTLILLYLLQLHFAYLRLKKRHISILAAMFISIMMNALLHNNSILTGDLLVWILWGAIYSESKTSNLKLTISQYSIRNNEIGNKT